MIFKLIIRQVWKHRYGLVLVLLIWILGGYFIMMNRNTILVSLSNSFISLPKKGVQTQDGQERALDFVREARNRLHRGQVGFWCRYISSNPACKAEETTHGNVNLRLMEKACHQVTGRYDTIKDIYRPHWLDRIREWNLSTLSRNKSLPDNLLTGPSEYWSQNKSLVMESLKNLVDGISYAYEIPPGIQEGKNRETILLPQLIEEYSRALCRDDIAIMVWGDYIEFQELRAYAAVRKENIDFEKDYLYPIDQELRVLKKLRETPAYALALEKYVAGEPPQDGNPESCNRRNNYRLSCLAPAEAVKTYNKLLYVRRSDMEQASNRLRLGNLYLMEFYRGSRDKTRSEFIRERSLSNLTMAAESRATERSARLNLTRIHLAERNFELAREQLLTLQQKLPGHNRGAYRRIVNQLIRTTLMGLDRHKDADCFAEFAQNPGGTLNMRTHCKELVL